MKHYTVKELRDLFSEYILTKDNSEQVESYETTRDSAMWAEDFIDWLESEEP